MKIKSSFFSMVIFLLGFPAGIFATEKNSRESAFTFSATARLQPCVGKHAVHRLGNGRD